MKIQPFFVDCKLNSLIRDKLLVCVHDYEILYVIKVTPEKTA